MAKLKLPFELEKPSSNEYVTQSSEVGHGNGSVKDALDKSLGGKNSGLEETNDYYRLFAIADRLGNVTLLLSPNGVEVKKLILDGQDLSIILANLLGSPESGASINNFDLGKLSFADESGNIVLRLGEQGVEVKKLILDGQDLSSSLLPVINDGRNIFSIADNNRKMILLLESQLYVNSKGNVITKSGEIKVINPLTEIISKMSIAHHVSAINNILYSDKDIYLTHWGDSLSAWQSAAKGTTQVLADEGVTNVPPVCDLKGFAYWVWKTYAFGNATYCRFDKGKYSLVGNWDDSLEDDSNAFFTEQGVFGTRYATSRVTNDGNNIANTTLITGEFQPYFDSSEVTSDPNNGQRQRNIPKRFSNFDSASVQFTIPAGYSKFDFIYNAHVDGDILSVSITGGNDKVIVNTSPNDWTNAVEANGYTFSSAHSPTESKEDTYGMQKRLHFQILDMSADTVVTITKTSDTSKYLIYWGISYWGTTKQPYALHYTNTARGGASMTTLWGKILSDIRDTNPDVVIIEPTVTNNFNNISPSTWSAFADFTARIYNYLASNNYVFATIIPHLAPAIINNNGLGAGVDIIRKAEGYINTNWPGSIVGNVHNTMQDAYNLYYSSDFASFAEFVRSFMYQGPHPNYEGFLFYQGIINKSLK